MSVQSYKDCVFHQNSLQRLDQMYRITYRKFSTMTNISFLKTSLDKRILSYADS